MYFLCTIPAIISMRLRVFERLKFQHGYVEYGMQHIKTKIAHVHNTFLFVSTVINKKHMFRKINFDIFFEKLF